MKINILDTHKLYKIPLLPNNALDNNEKIFVLTLERKITKFFDGEVLVKQSWYFDYLCRNEYGI